jgi:predicted cupin superfamily sugar epimerase
MNSQAQALIQALGLEPLAGEGGFYRRIHTFTDGVHEVGSVIYYLITAENFSSLHWLPTDEVWYFLEGDPVEQLVLYPDGSYSLLTLGNASEGRTPLSVVKGECWQGTKLAGQEGWALCATSMCPPYDSRSYRQGGDFLQDQYPACTLVEAFLGKEA